MRGRRRPVDSTLSTEHAEMDSGRVHVTRTGAPQANKHGSRTYRSLQRHLYRLRDNKGDLVSTVPNIQPREPAHPDASRHMWSAYSQSIGRYCSSLSCEWLFTHYYSKVGVSVSCIEYAARLMDPSCPAQRLQHESSQQISNTNCCTQDGNVTKKMSSRL